MSSFLFHVLLVLRTDSGESFSYPRHSEVKSEPRGTDHEKKGVGDRTLRSLEGCRKFCGRTDRDINMSVPVFKPVLVCRPTLLLRGSRGLVGHRRPPSTTQHLVPPSHPNEWTL